MTVTFNPVTLAHGWIPVSCAASKEKERPALCKTIHIEQFSRGVRLISTDSYMLLTAWVPTVEGAADLDPEPSYDEAPLRTATAIDRNGRGKGLIQFAAQQAVADEEADVTVTLDLAAPLTGDDDGVLGGMERHSITLRVPGTEMVRLDCYEGEFPDWRVLVGSFAPVDTTQVALNPDILVRLSKAAAVQAKMLGWSFGGQDKVAKIELIDSEPHVEGLAMPCRWDLTTNTPWVDPEVRDLEDENHDDFEPPAVWAPSDATVEVNGKSAPLGSPESVDLVADVIRDALV